MRFGSLLTEKMNTAMDIRIHGIIFFRNSINDTTRLLGRGRIVEIDERLAVYFALQNRKIVSDGCCL